MQQLEVWALLERHAGGARLHQYLAAADGDRDLAVELYAWNSAVAGRFWESLGHLEVAFRNTIDARMSARSARRADTEHWIFDDAHELGRSSTDERHRRPYSEIANAIRRVRQNGRPVQPDQVISELPFGFWHQMVSKQQRFLWPDLAAGFPGAPTRTQSLVHDPVARLRTFRNRIAHQHAIWSHDIAGRHEDVLTLAGYIDPALRDWITEHSDVATMIGNSPLR